MTKKVLVIGATGTLGRAIVTELERDCLVIKVGNSSGDEVVDIASTDSIRSLYRKHQDADAVVCAAARGVIFKPLSDMTKEDYVSSMHSKQLGQIDLVLLGVQLLKATASFTLTSGILNVDPIAQGSAAAMVNGSLEGFVRAAAIDMPAKQRINLVSPALLVESVEQYRGFFEGFHPVPAATVALAYRKSIMGQQTGQIFCVH